jgi:hypothetical protein
VALLAPDVAVFACVLDSTVAPAAPLLRSLDEPQPSTMNTDSIVARVRGDAIGRADRLRSGGLLVRSIRAPRDLWLSASDRLMLEHAAAEPWIRLEWSSVPSGTYDVPRGRRSNQSRWISSPRRRRVTLP